MKAMGSCFTFCGFTPTVVDRHGPWEYGATPAAEDQDKVHCAEGTGTAEIDEELYMTWLVSMAPIPAKGQPKGRGRRWRETGDVGSDTKVSAGGFTLTQGLDKRRVHPGPTSTARGCREQHQ